MGLFPALIAAPAGAACPGSCAIPGGGSSATDCLVEHDGAVPNFPASRPKEVRCTDGDPTCDADGVANGSCRFPIAVCVNNTDPRFPACTPTDIVSYQIKNKPHFPKNDPELNALEAAATALLPTSSAVCTARQTMTVPLKVTAGVFRPARKRIRSIAASSAGTKDVDLVKMRCLAVEPLPAPGRDLLAREADHGARGADRRPAGARRDRRLPPRERQDPGRHPEAGPGDVRDRHLRRQHHRRRPPARDR